MKGTQISITHKFISEFSEIWFYSIIF